MKQIYILIAFLFLTFINLNAQITDVVTGVGCPQILLEKNNKLYMALNDGARISKIDMTISSPAAKLVRTGIAEVSGMVLVGNDLYFTRRILGNISKIDITTTSPTVIDVATGFTAPGDLHISGNYIYASDVF